MYTFCGYDSYLALIGELQAGLQVSNMHHSKWFAIVAVDTNISTGGWRWNNGVHCEYWRLLRGPCPRLRFCDMRGNRLLHVHSTFGYMQHDDPHLFQKRSGRTLGPWTKTAAVVRHSCWQWCCQGMSEEVYCLYWEKAHEERLWITWRVQSLHFNWSTFTKLHFITKGSSILTKQKLPGFSPRRAKLPRIQPQSTGSIHEKKSRFLLLLYAGGQKDNLPANKWTFL